ncbi:MAG TPA: O-antigen ligase family protein [Candidatus Wallbacteria bacterium]|nr:O-antigen ligase family protein [Candidatus Wallbacteria bacterium]
MINNGLLLLIPLFTPLVFSKMTQDSFLFPKEIFFITVTGLVFFYRCVKIFKDKKESEVYFSPIDAALISLLLLSAVSVVFRADFYPAIHPFVTVLSAAVFYYEIKFFNKTSSVYGLFADCFVISGLIAVIFGFFQYYRLDFIFAGSLPADKMRLFSFFGNKNYFSEYLTAVFFIIAAKIFILAIGCGRHKNLIKNRAALLSFYTVSLVLYFAMIFIIQSRASFVALAAGSLYCAASIYRSPCLRGNFYNARGIFYGLVFALALAAALYSFSTPLTNDKTDLAGRIGSIFKVSAERNIAIRLDIWRATAKMISDHFWFGCGLGYFKMNYLSYQSLLFKENSNVFYENQFFAKANQAHNEFLQIFCELGVFGFASSLALFFILVYASRKAASVYSGPSGAVRHIVAFCSFAGILSVAINSMFGFPLHILPTALVFLTFINITDGLIFKRMSRPAGFSLFSGRYAFSPFRPNVALILAAAASVYLMIFSLAPAYVGANINMKAGLDLIKMSMPHKASAYLEKSIKANPFNGETHYYMGICHMQKKEYDSAVMEFLKSLQSESDPNIFSNLGMAFYKIGMYDYALNYTLKALEISPNDIYYLLNAGSACQKLGKYESAVEYFQKALSYASTPEAVINLGHSYYLMGIYDKAEAVLSDALARYGANAFFSKRIYYLLGLCFLDSKKYGPAIANLKNARAMDLKNRDYVLNLGLAYIMSANTAEAEILFGDFLREDFSDLIAYNLGGLYYGEKRFSDALVVLNKVKAGLESGRGREALENDRLYKATIGLINDIKNQINK